MGGLGGDFEEGGEVICFDGWVLWEGTLCTGCLRGLGGGGGWGWFGGGVWGGVEGWECQGLVRFDDELVGGRVWGGGGGCVKGGWGLVCGGGLGGLWGVCFWVVGGWLGWLCILG